MRYKENKEKSAEYLRLALPLMTRQAASLHPIHYAVWYEYVAGMNAALKENADRLLADGKPLDEDDIASLYRQHVAEIDEAAAQRVAQGFEQVLQNVGRSVDDAGDHANRFGMALEQWSEGLAEPSADADRAQVLRDTRQMQQAMAQLKANLAESRREVEHLQLEVARAREDSLSDGLTGLVNRKGFDLALSACLAAGSETAASGPSLLITDIDHFKQVNDTYGHLFGDKVIRVVAEILKANVKGKDVAARYGGEEFVVLLPDTPLEGARALAEKIRSTIAASRIRRADSNETLAKVTVSLGVCSYRPGESSTDFIGRADQALYASKTQGRNQVTVAAAA